jgi:hypothetical protein
MLPNLGMLDGIPAARHFDPLRIAEHEALIDEITALPAAEQIAALQAAGVGVMITDKPRDDLAPVASSGALWAYAVPDPWPRVTLAVCVPQGTGLRCAPQVQPGVTIVRDEAEHLALQVEAEAAGYVLVLDTYYPGWKAAVDGEPAVIRRANGVFRAVEVEAGTHEVTLEYHPASLRIGAAAAGFALLIVLALAVWPFRARRSKGVAR